METVNDLDGDLISFWRVLRDRPADLARVCALTPHARAEFEACADLSAGDEVDRLQAERDQLRARLGQAWTATEALADEVGYPPLGDLRAALLIDGRAPASKGAHDA